MTSLNNPHSSKRAVNRSMVVCKDCHRVSEANKKKCPRCGTILSFREPNSVQQCLALLCTALLFYIPANLYPIMVTTSFGTASGSTIIGGVRLFIEEGSYGIALIIFVASVLVPMAKIAALFILCLGTRTNSNINPRELMTLYRLVEFVGKWSMLDIFVVAIMVGLVQLGSLMVVEPGIAAIAFCMVVILTIIAAKKFDSRLIWDRLAK